MRCKICGGECGLVCRGLGFERSGMSSEVPNAKSGASANDGPRAPLSAIHGDGGRLGAIQAAPDTSRKGRPRLEDRPATIEAQAPWIALGMSRRTWYRRQKESAVDFSAFPRQIIAFKA